MGSLKGRILSLIILAFIVPQISFASNQVFLSSTRTKQIADLTITPKKQPVAKIPTLGCGPSGSYSNGLLKGVPCDKPITTLPQVIAVIKNVMNQILLPISGTIFTIMIIVGGIVYITSHGNEQQIGRGKKILTAAIIGLLITSLAFVIVTFFATAIGGGVK